jgi:1-acyl-sn-glycerol-3-phosphate acyltransferase
MAMPPVRERRWARRLLALAGWRVEVVPPPGPRCVIAVYPHTSNWDFVVGYLAKLAAGLPVHFVGKHTLFRGPLRPLLRGMGGIPVDRTAPTGLIGQLVSEMETRPWMWLAIAPEGTRARVEHLKSGFYRVALVAKTPIGLASIDWRTRVVELTEYFLPSGDEAADLERIRRAWAGKVGRHPALAGEIRFRRRPGASR